MAELNDLSPTPGSRADRKRLGRGPGSGTGKTSGRGHKGQRARAGASIPAGFEGGQMPLQRRVPKGGFTQHGRIEYQVVNVSVIDQLAETDVSPEVLRSHGLIGSLKEPTKILGDGEIGRAVSVSAHAFSGSAREKIEAAGGSVTTIDR